MLFIYLLTIICGSHFILIIHLHYTSVRMWHVSLYWEITLVCTLFFYYCWLTPQFPVRLGNQIGLICFLSTNIVKSGCRAMKVHFSHWLWHSLFTGYNKELHKFWLRVSRNSFTRSTNLPSNRLMTPRTHSASPQLLPKSPREILPFPGQKEIIFSWGHRICQVGEYLGSLVNKMKLFIDIFSLNIRHRFLN